MIREIPPEEAPNGGVLYDGSCGFCGWWAPYWERTLKKSCFAIATLQSSWVVSRLGQSGEELLRDVLLLKNDGCVVRGAEVYRAIMRRIWWAYPLYVFSILPDARSL